MSLNCTSGLVYVIPLLLLFRAVPARVPAASIQYTSTAAYLPRSDQSTDHRPHSRHRCRGDDRCDQRDRVGRCDRRSRRRPDLSHLHGPVRLGHLWDGRYVLLLPLLLLEWTELQHTPVQHTSLNYFTGLTTQSCSILSCARMARSRFAPRVQGHVEFVRSFQR